MRESPQTAASLSQGGGGREWLPLYGIVSGEKERRERTAQSRVGIEGDLRGRWDKTIDDQYKNTLAEFEISSPEYSQEECC